MITYVIWSEYSGRPTSTDHFGIQIGEWIQTANVSRGDMLAAVIVSLRGFSKVRTNTIAAFPNS